MVEICVLILGHNGVHQAAVWNSWAAYMKEGASVNVHFGVISNKEVKAGKQFTKKHNLGIYTKTAWCTLSLVKVYIAGLKKMMDKFPDSEYVFFASGADIPIANPGAIIELIEKNKSCFAYTNKKREECTQWIHLTAEHAKIMMEFKRWDRLKKYLKDPEAVCFDEYVPILIAAHTKSTHLINDDALTDFERENEDSKSPIEWDDFKTKKLVYRTRGDTHVMKSLETVLLSEVQQNFFFFRKVGREVTGKPGTKLLKVLPWLSEINKY
jgi:hypothetical protein